MLLLLLLLRLIYGLAQTDREFLRELMAALKDMR